MGDMENTYNFLSQHCKQLDVWSLGHNVCNEFVRDGKRKQRADLLDEPQSSSKMKGKSSFIRKRIELGGKDSHMYLTWREAECMELLMRGKAIVGAAVELGLSPRTVEYYISRIKAKLDCRSKYKLIDLLYQSDFLKNFNLQKNKER